MIASLMTWCLVVALGQAPGAPGEAAWLKAVPGDAEVVLRFRGAEPVRNDLVTMLEAMSPTLAAQAKPALQTALEQMRVNAGEEAIATDAPILVVIRLPGGNDPPAGPRVALYVRTKDYAALQRSVAGPDHEAKPQARPGGYDALSDRAGNPSFTFQGDGFAVVANDEGLIRGIAAPKSTLDGALGGELRDRLLGGDAGVYVNLAAVRSRYGDQIEQLRQAILAGVERGAAGTGGPKVGAMIRGAYGGLFDTFKDARALAVSIDLAAEGLALTGRITVAPDSPAARSLADARSGTADLLARLPADSTFFLDLNVDPSSYQSLQNLSMSFLRGAGGELSEELQKVMRLQSEAGPREVAATSAFGRGGARTVNLMTFDDPRKAVESFDRSFQAMRAKPRGLEWIKDVRIQPRAQTHGGFELARATMSLDLDRLAKLQPETPGAAALLRAMLGETMSTWYGTDGKVVLSVTAPDWEQARALIDAATAGRGSLGSSAGFRAVRSRLPERLGGAFLLSAQGFVRQMSAQLAALQPENPNIKPPADLPREPALFGGALSPAADGYQFQAVVPSAVGPVIEQGLLPLFQGIQARAPQQ